MDNHQLEHSQAERKEKVLELVCHLTRVNSQGGCVCVCVCVGWKGEEVVPVSHTQEWLDL
jgi:hypothetical protein